MLTRYLSVATETKIKSSPTRTFSPSDLEYKYELKTCSIEDLIDKNYLCLLEG